METIAILHPPRCLVAVLPRLVVAFSLLLLLLLLSRLPPYTPSHQASRKGAKQSHIFVVSRLANRVVWLSLLALALGPRLPQLPLLLASLICTSLRSLLRSR